eukprot:TRINITY_DN40347_c0_g1_i1.p1 TRINITY_DN40347_c0_g1~~TRINITY_DN40347_c0_g1_i1.p1  ORF type:complete len:321 (-),score=52.95 TRINITY_DN40347_c0_g1_i1:78-1040(-)
MIREAQALFQIIGTPTLTEAELDTALKICCTARAQWQREPSLAMQYEDLLNRLQNWEGLTAEDGLEDPSQAFLALTALCSCESPQFCKAMASTAILLVTNEMLARRAQRLFKNDLEATGCVSRFLGLEAPPSPFSPKQEMDGVRPRSLEQIVSLSCEEFDFKQWAWEVFQPVLHAFAFASAFRGALARRGGGWTKLEKDMDLGGYAYADVLDCLQSRGATSQMHQACDFDAADTDYVLAAMVAQAMLFRDSSTRQSLPDVRHTDLLSEMAIDLQAHTEDMKVLTPMRRNVCECSVSTAYPWQWRQDDSDSDSGSWDRFSQ